MATRKELDSLLREIPGIDRVYFQPPPNFQMEFDCIVYELADIHTRRADNKHYVVHKRYTVTLVMRKYNEATIDALLNKFDMISFSREFRSDNLYHHVFDLYF